MIVRIVSLKCKPEDVDAFRLLLRQFMPRVLSAPGCLSLRIVGDVDKPTSFYTISAWRSVEDLDAYRNSPLFGDIWPRVRGMLRERAWASTCEDISG